ncbi:MAG: hypothetical protein ACOC8H_00395 [bacterium]
MLWVASRHGGTGVKTKTVKAICLGQAMVTTPGEVSEPWEADEEAMSICRDPACFAAATVSLLTNETMRRQAEERARGLRRI